MEKIKAEVVNAQLAEIGSILESTKVKIRVLRTALPGAVIHVPRLVPLYNGSPYSDLITELPKETEESINAVLKSMLIKLDAVVREENRLAAFRSSYFEQE